MRRFTIILALVSAFTAFSADAPSVKELAGTIKVLPDPAEPSRIELSNWEGYPGKDIVLQYTVGGGSWALLGMEEREIGVRQFSAHRVQRRETILRPIDPGRRTS